MWLHDVLGLSGIVNRALGITRNLRKSRSVYVVLLDYTIRMDVPRGGRNI
jgi:hypothetical protein